MYKIAVCVIAKWEEQYLVEWVEHYKNMGFDNILFYDNNEVNNDEQLNVLKPYIDNGFIIYHDLRGKTGSRVQKDCYENCLKQYKDIYNWIAFFDADEFIEFANHATIKEFLSSNENFDKYDGVSLNWVNHTDSNNLYHKEGRVQDRFTETIYEERNQYKTIVNTKKYKLKRIKSVHNLGGINLCDEEGCTFDKYGKYLQCKEFKDNISFIKHYRTKSTEEFIKKIKRGYCNGGYTVFNESTYKMFYRQYFRINKKTKEKVKMFSDTFVGM